MNTTIRGFLTGEDTLHTAKAVQSLGIDVVGLGTGNLVVRGKGLDGLREPQTVLDLGNSGTGMRLLAGLLAGQDFFSVVTGDQYLRKRPMGRIVEPLRKMGAAIDGRSKGTSGASCRSGAQAAERNRLFSTVPLPAPR